MCVCLCVFSVIEVSSPELAKKTVEVMHRADLRGRQIIVREASSVYFVNHELSLLQQIVNSPLVRLQQEA